MKKVLWRLVLMCLALTCLSQLYGYHGDQRAVVFATNGTSITSLNACSDVNFGNPTTFTAGDNPGSIVVRDFNKDGNLDLAANNFLTSQVSVLLGNGMGGFGSPASFNVGGRPFEPTSADFNGDGKLDLAVVNSGLNEISTVSILVGDGAGGFDAPIDFAEGGISARMAVAEDLNGDGRIDLVVGNGGAGSNVSVLLNTCASAVTQVAIDIKPGSFPNSINLGSGGSVPVAIFSTADFDARTVDPLTVTLAGAQVKLKGKGTPQASFEDVNGDGLLDLVVHVSTEALQLSESDTEAVLEGMTFGGMRIRGMDSVRIVP
jgi:hypothetical protein